MASQQGVDRPTNSCADPPDLQNGQDDARLFDGSIGGCATEATAAHATAQARAASPATLTGRPKVTEECNSPNISADCDLEESQIQFSADWQEQLNSVLNDNQLTEADYVWATGSDGIPLVIGWPSGKPQFTRKPEQRNFPLTLQFKRSGAERHYLPGQVPGEVGAELEEQSYTKRKTDEELAEPSRQLAKKALDALDSMKKKEQKGGRQGAGVADAEAAIEASLCKHLQTLLNKDRQNSDFRNFLHFYDYFADNAGNLIPGAAAKILDFRFGHELSRDGSMCKIKEEGLTILHLASTTNMPEQLFNDLLELHDCQKLLNNDQASRDMELRVDAGRLFRYSMKRMTPLSYAVAHCSSSIVKCLINRNADANENCSFQEQTETHATPVSLLFLACAPFDQREPNVDIVQCLLEHPQACEHLDTKCSTFGQSLQQYTPLHVAVRRNHVEIAKLLIDVEADVQMKAAGTHDNEPEQSIMDDAYERQNADLVMCLAKNGAQPPSKHSFWRSGLAAAYYQECDPAEFARTAQNYQFLVDLLHSAQSNFDMDFVCHFNETLNKIFPKKRLRAFEGRTFSVEFAPCQVELTSLNLFGEGISTWESFMDGSDVSAAFDIQFKNLFLFGTPPCEGNSQNEEVIKLMRGLGYKSRADRAADSSKRSKIHAGTRCTSKVDVHTTIIRDVHRIPAVFDAIYRLPPSMLQMIKSSGLKAVLHFAWSRFWTWPVFLGIVAVLDAGLSFLAVCVADHAAFLACSLFLELVQFAFQLLQIVASPVGLGQPQEWLINVLVAFMKPCFTTYRLSDGSLTNHILFRMVLQVLALVKWLQVLACCQSIERWGIGCLIIPIIDAMRSVWPFAVMATLLLLALTHGYQALSTTNNDFFAAIFLVYRLGLLADFDVSQLEGSNAIHRASDKGFGTLAREDPPKTDMHFIVVVMVMAGLFFIAVTLLNIYTGVLSAAYSESHEVAKYTFMQHRARILRDLQCMEDFWNSLIGIHKKEAAETFMWYCVEGDAAATADRAEHSAREEAKQVSGGHQLAGRQNGGEEEIRNELKKILSAREDSKLITDLKKMLTAEQFDDFSVAQKNDILQHLLFDACCVDNAAGVAVVSNFGELRDALLNSDDQDPIAHVLEVTDKFLSNPLATKREVTPLQVATLTGNEKLVHHLLIKRANTYTGCRNCQPLDDAMNEGHHRIVTQLVEHIYSTPPPEGIYKRDPWDDLNEETAPDTVWAYMRALNADKVCEIYRQDPDRLKLFLLCLRCVQVLQQHNPIAAAKAQREIVSKFFLNCNEVRYWKFKKGGQLDSQKMGPANLIDGVNVSLGPDRERMDDLFKNYVPIENDTSRRKLWCWPATPTLAGGDGAKLSLQKSESDAFANLLQQFLGRRRSTMPCIQASEDHAHVEVYQCIVRCVHQSPQILAVLSGIEFESEHCKAIVHLAWESGQVGRTAWACLRVACAVLSIQLARVGEDRSASHEDIQHALLALDSLVLMVEFLECASFVREGLVTYYVSNYGQWLDLVFGFWRVAFGIYIISSRSAIPFSLECRVVDALSGAQRWWEVLYESQGLLSSVGKQIHLILWSIQTSLPFLFITCAVFIGCIQAYLTLDVPDRNFAEAWLLLYRLLLASDFELSELEASDPILVQHNNSGTALYVESDPDPTTRHAAVVTFVVGSSLFVTITLLNLYIGILSTSYENAGERKEQLWLQHKARLSLSHACLVSMLHTSFKSQEHPALASLYLWHCYKSSLSKEDSEGKKQCQMEDRESQLPEEMEGRHDLDENEEEDNLQCSSTSMQSLRQVASDECGHSPMPVDRRESPNAMSSFSSVEGLFSPASSYAELQTTYQDNKNFLEELQRFDLVDEMNEKLEEIRSDMRAQVGREEQLLRGRYEEEVKQLQDLQSKCVQFLDNQNKRQEDMREIVMQSEQLKYQLAQKERESEAKANQIEHMSRQMEQLSSDLEVQRETYLECVDKVKRLEANISYREVTTLPELRDFLADPDQTDEKVLLSMDAVEHIKTQQEKQTQIESELSRVQGDNEEYRSREDNMNREFQKLRDNLEEAQRRLKASPAPGDYERLREQLFRTEVEEARTAYRVAMQFTRRHFHPTVSSAQKLRSTR
eukprot:TRINITY_DN31778_c0_g1_i1.p1 TRINITY_DN31778_c0_g1~~TRINITY_DN31778_c0_g1_i1.p1  ORF type:complete len:2117 (+),score=323.25 TRINITY_DN31778_c0_g1_i1:30-6353(+)